MAIETERKFLVHRALWEKLEKPAPHHIRQGYITTDPARTVRIRIKDSEAFFTIKGATKGFSRTEVECALPVLQAQEMLDHFAVSEIRKMRFEIPYGQHTWEVDVFGGDNEPLIVAEIELAGEADTFLKPGWVAEEVTGDERYYNAWLSLHPFRTWQKQ